MRILAEKLATLIGQAAVVIFGSAVSLMSMALLLHACTPGSVGGTIKTIDDIAVALCEVAAKDDPSIVAPGQTLEEFCHGADVLQSFKAEASGAKQRAVMHLKTPVLKPPPSIPPMD